MCINDFHVNLAILKFYLHDLSQNDITRINVFSERHIVKTPDIYFDQLNLPAIYNVLGHISVRKQFSHTFLQWI